MSGTVISYPIPIYANVPIQAQFYQPSVFQISNVTLGVTTIVTTTVNHNYVIGQSIRLLIPSVFGCFQLNNIQGIVISLPNLNQIEIAINSSQNVDNYIAASSKNQAQIIAIGDFNSGIISTTGIVQTSTNIPGSFQNISPL